MIDVISCQDAKKQGLKKYFTGLPCSRGHIAERYVKTNNCVICAADSVKSWHKTNPHKRKEYNTKYRSKPEVIQDENQSEGIGT